MEVLVPRRNGKKNFEEFGEGRRKMENGKGRDETSFKDRTGTIINKRKVESARMTREKEVESSSESKGRGKEESDFL